MGCAASGAPLDLHVSAASMTFTFTLHKESLKRKFAVYVVVARSSDNTKLYVGKTGDNNDGCNPLISRCGNHFSYNKMHSQIRNHLDDHEERDYIYVFDHFDDYPEDDTVRRTYIDKINEMERWLNEEIQKAIEGKKPFNFSIRLPDAVTCQRWSRKKEGHFAQRTTARRFPA